MINDGGFPPFASVIGTRLSNVATVTDPTQPMTRKMLDDMVGAMNPDSTEKRLSRIEEKLDLLINQLAPEIEV